MGIHVLVLDKNGDAAVIEFLDGHMKAHTGDELPVAVSTNDTYGKSLQCLRKNGLPLFDQGLSISRFIKAAKMIQVSRAKPQMSWLHLHSTPWPPYHPTELSGESFMTTRI